jgi:hypothetical protein
VYAEMRITPPGLTGLVILQGELLARMVDAMLGRDPGPGKALATVRSITPIKEQIVRRICSDLADELVDAWPPGATPRIDVGRPTNRWVSIARRDRDRLRTVSVYSAALDFGLPTHSAGLLCCTSQYRPLACWGAAPRRPSTWTMRSNWCVRDVMKRSVSPTNSARLAGIRCSPRMVLMDASPVEPGWVRAIDIA